MSLITVGYIAIVAMLALILLGVPIAWSMAIVGVLGELYVTGFTAAASKLSLTLWENGTLFVFIALPLFLLMGQLAYRTGITDDLYDCISKWFGHLPGGVAVSAVLSNAAYGAVTGSSIASVATLGPMVMPEFRKYRYDLSLATGTLASAGTLAVLVPPSTLLVIYGVWTETSIAELFMAGIVPCLLLTVVYCSVLALWCALKPEVGPRGPSHPWPARLASLRKLLPALVLIGVVLGGIYGGVMTPSESAAVGVLGVLAIAAAMRNVSFASPLGPLVHAHAARILLSALSISWRAWIDSAAHRRRLACSAMWLNASAWRRKVCSVMSRPLAFNWAKAYWRINSCKS